MKRAAVFFDRDNTLIVSDGYLGDPKQVVLVEGAADAIAKCRSYGFVAVTISNQSGVARGMFGEQDVDAVNRRMDELLLAQNGRAVVSRHEYCPYHPEATIDKYRQDSPMRKPRPGMILAAAEKLNLDLSRSWMIGDTPRDVEAGRAAGCRTILFTHPTLAPSPASGEQSAVEPEFRAASLKEAIEIVGREMYRRPTPAPVSVTLGSALAPSPLAAPALAVAAVAASDGDTLPNELNDEGESHFEDDHHDPAPEPAMAVMSHTSLSSDASLLLPPDDDHEFMSYPPVGSRNGEATAVLNAPPPSEPEPAGSPMQTTPAPLPPRPASQPQAHAKPVAPAILTPTREQAPLPLDPSPSQTPLTMSTAKLESISEQILQELKRRREEPTDFSVSKLFAGIVQVLVLAVLFLAYLQRDNATNLQSALLWGIMLQTLTIALLIMGRQR